MPFAILQPVLIPDLHDIATMKAADKVIIQNTETWSRKGRTHRALIRTPEGTDYLNVPVVSADKKKEIRYVRINHDEDWIEPILRSLKFNYSNSVYYDFYEPEIASLFWGGRDFDCLINFSAHIKNRLFEFLEIRDEIKAEFILSSEMPSYDPDPDQLSDVLSDDIYFQEHDARHYQRQGENKSTLPFTHPQYRQHFDGFEPYCCLLDLLFQYGPESFRVIDQV
ncbi:WbqC family protein [Rhodohalobacter sp. 8-1]|uniref:WbqC family protein n=1 Tax=Rhodohalobacter sp. 8-1 TaxID=3131972 RepID=UPI0030EF0636